MKCPFKFPSKKLEPIEGDHTLRIYRLHPSGASFEKANNNLSGDANEGAVKYCGPYIHANQSGWWVNPPFDMDILYNGDGTYTEKMLEDFENLEHYVIRSNLREEDKFRDTKRMLLGKGLVAPDVYQIWTGSIFRTPPGWGLHVRSPINFTEVHKRPFWIQEGILETDWMAYDIWLNLEFFRPGEVVKLRRNMWPPLAQMVPVRRESYQSKWEKTDEIMDSSKPDHKDVWDFWQKYNYQKWKSTGQKETRTYHKTRKKSLKDMYPNQKHSEISLPNEPQSPQNN